MDVQQGQQHLGEVVHHRGLGQQHAAPAGDALAQVAPLAEFGDQAQEAVGLEALDVPQDARVFQVAQDLRLPTRGALLLLGHVFHADALDDHLLPRPLVAAQVRRPKAARADLADLRA